MRVRQPKPKFNNTRAGLLLDAGPHGTIRLIVRPEWSELSSEYVASVASAASGGQRELSNVYRLEPTFLIQGRLETSGVKTITAKTSRALKVMERGEVGWAGGSNGPAYFIYLGDGAATWLGNPHDGAIFAEVADEQSMAVAHAISRIPLGRSTKPGEMHTLTQPLALSVSAWAPIAEPPPLLKIKGASLDPASAHIPHTCHALHRTELHGDVVRWGADHLKQSASECCAACEAETRCDVWVYCGSASRCGAAHRQCWLKRQPQIWETTKKQPGGGLLSLGSSDRWIAGTKTAAPLEHPSGAGQLRPFAATAQFGLRVLAGGGARGGADAPTLRFRLRSHAAAATAARFEEIAEIAVLLEQAELDGGEGAPAVSRPSRATPASARALRQSLPPLASANATGGGHSGTGGGHSGPGAGHLDTAIDALLRLPCAALRCALTAAAPVPPGWGDETLVDGLGPSERWPLDRSVLSGSFLGRGSREGGLYELASKPVRPELIHPTQPVRAGSLYWRSNRQLAFDLALADHPHLGVSRSVFGDLVSEDQQIAEGIALRVALGEITLPLRFEIVGL